jgi:hypothetical protein
MGKNNKDKSKKKWKYLIKSTLACIINLQIYTND